MDNFMDLIDDQMRIPRRGSVVKGRIIQVNADSIFVNIGSKLDGIIPKSEVSSDNNIDLPSAYRVNDEIDVYIVNSDNGEGNVELSIKRVKADKDWETLEKLFQDGQEITVKVTEVVNGGVIAYFNELRGFIPASQLAEKFIKNLKPFVGKELKVKIVDVNRQKRRAVFSHKEIAIAEKKEKSDKFWSNIVVGAIVKGEVKRLTNFGAFVDVGGLDGLVHITELSWGRIRPAHEVLKIGEIIDVKIIDANRETNKVSLSVKQVTPEPWSDFEERYNVDYIYWGTVVNLTEFGAFVELEPGIEGLVHISHVSRNHVDKISDVLKTGDRVEVKILEYSMEEKRVKLSIKAVQEEDALFEQEHAEDGEDSQEDVQE